MVQHLINIVEDKTYIKVIGNLVFSNVGQESQNSNTNYRKLLLPWNTRLRIAKQIISASIFEYVESHADQFETIVDPKIFEEVGGDEQVLQQLHDFLQLALSCTQYEIERRPYMTDVARELVRIDDFSLRPSVRKAERESSFLKNGSMLLEDFIASCDGKSSPIHTYSADELVKATDNFDPSCLISEDSFFQLFRGFLDDGSVLIKKYFQGPWPIEVEVTSMASHDIIILMQMSTHKNVLKLLGCCLEFSIPALVLEYVAKGVLDHHGCLGDTESLPRKTRMLIAKKVANALAYLHIAFSRPIIHRDLNPTCIFLDDDYFPKLSNFSLSITIPPQQLHVEDDVKGTYRYADPTYMATGYITEKQIFIALVLPIAYMFQKGGKREIILG
ncbi:hypothetical protein DVH24_034407 [Malus domestica]|uniref:Protein kinase domain-containing protein n=1 Tax=Malus domestica TaxID=3750 RepID=A0A498IYR6_MALDO|nr:hypothetical protein DVH24_034407 [Malus domestica]